MLNHSQIWRLQQTHPRLLLSTHLSQFLLLKPQPQRLPAIRRHFRQRGLLTVTHVVTVMAWRLKRCHRDGKTAADVCIQHLGKEISIHSIIRQLKKPRISFHKRICIICIQTLAVYQQNRMSLSRRCPHSFSLLWGD